MIKIWNNKLKEKVCESAKNVCASILTMKVMKWTYK
jgi:hypothetical protein